MVSISSKPNENSAATKNYESTIQVKTNYDTSPHIKDVLTRTYNIYVTAVYYVILYIIRMPAAFCSDQFGLSNWNVGGLVGGWVSHVLENG